MRAAVSNLFSNHSSRRRSTPATMYDLIDQCHEYESGMQFHDQGGENDYQDGFWKVFMLNEKPGKNTRCCERSSSFNTHGYQDSKMTDLAECSASCYCMKHSKTARRRRFKSQSGYYLAIMPNGQIMGIKDKNSPYSKSNVFSFDHSFWWKINCTSVANTMSAASMSKDFEPKRFSSSFF